MDRREMARRRLDARIAGLGSVSCFAVPPRGWVRAIRDALGMTSVQLGQRLGIKAQSVGDLEKSEAAETVKLETLRRAAAALDCTLVYALIPNSSLEGAVQTQARQLARQQLDRARHTMALEAQGTPDGYADEDLDDYACEHLRARDLWELP